MKLHCLALAVMVGVPAWADTIAYSSLPVLLPPNVPSLAYEASSVNEFGDLVELANGPAVLQSATVGMSDWALESDYGSAGELGGSTLTAAGFTIPLTLNLYNVGAGNSVGSVIGSYEIADAFIPWRPAASPDCGTAWLASDGNCYNGLLSTVTFDLPAVSVPGEFIYGLAFNTADYGYSPTHVRGPYNSLNFALILAPPSVGSNPQGGLGYWSTSSVTPMSQVNTGGYIGEIEFGSTPEPAGIALTGMGLLGLCLGVRRARLRAR